VQATFTVKKYLADIGRKGGLTKSAAKSKAARENGKLGGHPKNKGAYKRKPSKRAKPKLEKL
jgi:general stress protein YciG